jgi:mannose-6-phosphate isomerase-like protein (cupin superfamily)
MVDVAVLDLKDPKKWNHWVIGTPEEVAKTSPFYSEQLQVRYNKNLEKTETLRDEVEHRHTPPIEEYYFVLNGTLKVKVEDDIIEVEPMQILAVPPNKLHRVVDQSFPSEVLVFRAPISSRKTKIETI